MQRDRHQRQCRTADDGHRMTAVPQSAGPQNQAQRRHHDDDDRGPLRARPRGDRPPGGRQLHHRDPEQGPGEHRLDRRATSATCSPRSVTSWAADSTGVSVSSG